MNDHFVNVKFCRFFVLFWFGLVCVWFFQEVKFCNDELIMIIFQIPLFFKNKQTPGVQGS